MERAAERDVRTALLDLDQAQLQTVLSDREWEALTMGHRERVGDMHLAHIAELPAVLPPLFAEAPVARALELASMVTSRADRIAPLPRVERTVGEEIERVPAPLTRTKPSLAEPADAVV